MLEVIYQHERMPTLFLHDLTFETKEQAEMAARHLTNVVSVRIEDIDDIADFVDVPQAFGLEFRTTYALDERMQAVLSNQVGLLPEMPPKFNLDAEQEDAIAAGMEEDLASVAPDLHMAASEIITLIRWYLDQAIASEKRAYAVYRDADEQQRATALGKLQFCAGKRHAWQEVAEKIAGIPAQSVLILDDAPSVPETKVQG